MALSVESSLLCIICQTMCPFEARAETWAGGLVVSERPWESMNLAKASSNGLISITFTLQGGHRGRHA